MKQRLVTVSWRQISVGERFFWQGRAFRKTSIHEAINLVTARAAQPLEGAKFKIWQDVHENSKQGQN